MITLRENKDLQENQEAKEGRVHRYDNVSTVCVDELLPLATKRRYLCCPAFQLAICPAFFVAIVVHYLLFSHSFR